MESVEKCELLADKIKQIFYEGINVDEDGMHFIDSTFLTPSVSELNEIIKDKSNSERDSLLELIFYPDEALQTRLEEILGKEDFDKKDEEKVLSKLLSKKIKPVICFSDNRGSLEIEAPESVLNRFILRLNISKKPDQRLSRAIDVNVDPERMSLVRVKLRNSRIIFTENKIFFLISFFEKIKAKETIFFKCFDFIIDFFEEQQDYPDIYQALMDRKRFFYLSLQKAEKYDAQLKSKNTEILMLQGVRTPYIDKGSLEVKISLIDRVALAVYDLTEYMEPPDQCVETVPVRR